MIRVRIADESDQASLIEFIGDHWSSTHVFTAAPDLFRWQHCDGSGRLNMVLAERIVDGAPGSDAPESSGPDRDGETSILGILGFIPTGRFDPALGDRDVALAIWKVRDGAPPGLGLRLLKYLRAELSCRFIAAIGTSDIVRPIYQVLGYEVGTLHQSAVFGTGGSAVVADGVPAHAFERAAPAGRRIELRPLDSEIDRALAAEFDAIGSRHLPEKTWTYVVERYHRHPWFRYEVRSVDVDGAPEAIVVWRRVVGPGADVLRIVDVIGPTGWLRHAHEALQHEVDRVGAEYIDLMQIGIPIADLRAGGFISAGDHEGLVIPNYFSPFERRNMSIELAYRAFDDDRPVVLYRADSDQDRPNRIGDLA